MHYRDEYEAENVAVATFVAKATTCFIYVGALLGLLAVGGAYYLWMK